MGARDMLIGNYPKYKGGEHKWTKQMGRKQMVALEFTESKEEAYFNNLRYTPRELQRTQFCISTVLSPISL